MPIVMRPPFGAFGLAYEKWAKPSGSAGSPCMAMACRAPACSAACICCAEAAPDDVESASGDHASRTASQITAASATNANRGAAGAGPVDRCRQWTADSFMTASGSTDHVAGVSQTSACPWQLHFFCHSARLWECAGPIGERGVRCSWRVCHLDMASLWGFLQVVKFGHGIAAIRDLVRQTRLPRGDRAGLDRYGSGFEGQSRVAGSQDERSIGSWLFKVAI